MRLKFAVLVALLSACSTGEAEVMLEVKTAAAAATVTSSFVFTVEAQC